MSISQRPLRPVSRSTGKDRAPDPVRAGLTGSQGVASLSRRRLIRVDLHPTLGSSADHEFGDLRALRDRGVLALLDAGVDGFRSRFPGKQPVQTHPMTASGQRPRIDDRESGGASGGLLTEHTMTKIMCSPRLKPKRRYLATHKHLETGSFSMGLFKKRKSRATRKAEAKALKHKAEVEAKLNAKSQRKRDKVETKSLKKLEKAEIESQHKIEKAQIATLKAQEKAAANQGLTVAKVRKYLGVARLLAPRSPADRLPRSHGGARLARHHACTEDGHRRRPAR